MRVSDRSTIRTFLRNLNNAQSAFAKTNQQIASGSRFERLSDDVSSGTRALRSKMDLYKSEKHLDNITSVAEEMKSTEDNMLAVNDLFADAATIALKALSQGKDSPSNPILMTEIKNIRESALQVMNSKFGQRYSFGGSNSSTAAPFSVNADGRLLFNKVEVDKIQKDATGYFYNDAAGDRKDIPMNEDVFLDVGLGIKMNASQIDDQTGFKVSYSGLEAFGFGVDAEGKTNNIFNTLVDLENSIKNYNVDTIGEAKERLTRQNDKFMIQVTDVGSKTKFLTNMQDRLTSKRDHYQEGISSLVATDDKAATMALAMNEYALKAILQIGAKVLPTSLMDFIR